ncbi:hypothetical protein NXH76_23205 [Blautia schinkii]|nr:hypothetical protein [Blautia schinkii]
MTVKEQKKKKIQSNDYIRSIFASAALATAIVSWFATAQGLQVYVFEHYWQAAIISAAVQGTLFAFSISAIPLMKRLKVLGSIPLVILWAVLLCASSIFSYVYISKAVYPESVFRADAHRILDEDCLSENFYLRDMAKDYDKKLTADMDSYIRILVSDEDNVQVTEENQSILQNLIDETGKYDEMGQISISLEKIKSGKYSSNDVDTLSNLIDNELKNLVTLKEQTNNSREFNETVFASQQGRLATFKDVTSDRYQAAESERDMAMENITNLDDEEKEIAIKSSLLNNCKTQIVNLENGLEKTLYNSSISLKAAMNQDSIDSEDVLSNATKIYENLLDNNVAATDERVVKYTAFRNAAREYAVMKDIEQDVESEITNLYEKSTEALLSEDKDTEVLVSENKDPETLASEDKNTEALVSENKWQKYWEERINHIRDLYKKIPEESLENVSKSEKIEMLSETERMYLSELNDFEKAWGLLFGEHKYKTLLIFSVVFAFGIDLFSFGVGLLLYALNSSKCKRQKM